MPLCPFAGQRGTGGVPIDLLDWYHLSSVKEESGEFEDYLRVKENLRRGSELRDDPLHEYMDKVEKIFEKSK